MFHFASYTISLPNNLTVNVNVEFDKMSFFDDDKIGQLEFPDIEDSLQVSLELTDKHKNREKTGLYPIDFLSDAYENDDDLSSFLSCHGIKNKEEFEEYVINLCITYSKKFDEAVDKLLKKINKTSD